MRALAVAWMLLLASFAAADNPLPAEPLLDAAPIARGDGALLDFLSKRTLQKTDPEVLKRLVSHLGGETKGDAEKAMAELIAYGPPTVQLLRDSLKITGSNKSKPRVDECLKWIDGPDAGGLVRAVIRQLARRKPASAADVLLSFLPTAEDEATADEGRHALVALAMRDGKIHPVLEEAALKESILPRRHLAIEIVCQAGPTDTIRKLLRDPSRDIRLRAAGYRLEQGDSEAVPVLIELLGEPASPEARNAHDALQRLAGPLATESTLGSPPKRDAWMTWWTNVTAETLLKYFRERTPDVDPDKAGDLIAALGSKTFKIRQKAETDLINLRGMSIPHLERAAKDPDLEVRRRAERCLQSILSAPDAPLSAAHARLLALRRPPEAAQTLLAFVAFADADTVIDEVRQTLRILARQNRDVIALLKAGLAERTSQRRAVAAEVLAEFAGPDQLPALRKLLGDMEPLVRFRTSLGLALRQERQSVPVLIDLLGVLPQEQAWLAEDALRRIAGEKAPAVFFDKEEANRQKCRLAWESWWKENSAQADLGGLQRRAAELGLTLVSLWDNGGNANYVVEMGRDQKQRWKIGDLGYVFDFVVLPGNRLLLTENTRHKVTERNFKGEVLWSYEINSPINCQRMPNGHTFIVAQDRAVIVDREKKEVLKVDRHGGLMGGQRFRDGRMLLVNGSGQCFLLDAAGALLKQIQIMGGMSNYGGVQELPNGRFLIAQHDRNKVSEYDLEGKLIWSADTPSPNFATRLTNGHTLVGSQDNRSMIELDRDGKQLSKHEPGMSVWRIRRR